jgi:hypothetical protein
MDTVPPCVQVSALRKGLSVGAGPFFIIESAGKRCQSSAVRLRSLIQAARSFSSFASAIPAVVKWRDILSRPFGSTPALPRYIDQSKI